MRWKIVRRQRESKAAEGGGRVTGGKSAGPIWTTAQEQTT